jgi:phosphoenolpyruvate synthase/pyruvate phosphate dikinase
MNDSKKDLGDLFTNQISLSELLESVNHPDLVKMRIEDTDKRDRLKILNQVINLPYDKPDVFEATEINNSSAEFIKYLETNENRLCALRLNPKKPELPKLRMRGRTVKNAVDWYKSLDINAIDYKANFIPHSDNTNWSTIFIINEKGIFGEIIEGDLHQLSISTNEKRLPTSFSYDFVNWTIDTDQEYMLERIKSVVEYLEVKSDEKKQILKNQLNTDFTNNYLIGYFEAVNTKETGTWFVDYNRILAKLYSDFTLNIGKEEKKLLQITGRPASPGKAIGKVKIIPLSEILTGIIKEDEILVCESTTPDAVPLMKKARAIVTDFGGILSHAAIVAREMGKPCIVGTEIATKELKNGDEIEVDAFKGIIRVII